MPNPERKYSITSIKQNSKMTQNYLKNWMVKFDILEQHF